jgi:hypothetical protein
MSLRLEGIAKKINYQYHQVLCINEQFGKLGMLKAMAEVQCSPQDVVFYYYTGHGYNTTEQTSIFPLLYLKDDNNTELESVHAILKTKKPRLCITLGDCCNNLLADSRSMRPVPPLFKGIGVTPDLSILSRLFAQTEGDILITSAKRGEKAAAHSSLGSFYSFAWLEALDNAASNNSSISWETLLNDAENRLQEEMKVFPDSIRHHSQWVIGLKDSPPIEPVGPSPIVTFDQINKFLNTLADEDLPFTKRNALRIQKQQEYFASSATVDIYINSPEKPVERPPIENFLKRIVSTARLIDRFNFVEKMSTCSQDGKYTLVTLQEVRSSR